MTIINAFREKLES